MRVITNKNRRIQPLVFFCISLFISFSASAAFIAFDDSDLDFITITAGDFENGFSVNGSLLTTGLGNSASITLVDGAHSFKGSWIDLGLASGVSEISFALPGDPTFVTSGMFAFFTTDGTNGTIDVGSFGGFTGIPGDYFFTTGATLEQNGQTGFAGQPFLTMSFISEVAAVSEPATLTLLSLGFSKRKRLHGKGVAYLYRKQLIGISP